MVGGQAEDMGPCGTESMSVGQCGTVVNVDHSKETRSTPKELLRHHEKEPVANTPK